MPELGDILADEDYEVGGAERFGGLFVHEIVPELGLVLGGGEGVDDGVYAVGGLLEGADLLLLLGSWIGDNGPVGVPGVLVGEEAVVVAAAFVPLFGEPPAE